MSSQITHTHTIINIRSLAHILDTCALSLITDYPNLIMLRRPTPLQVITTGAEHERAVRNNTGQSKNGRVKLIQLHMYQGTDSEHFLSPLISLFTS